MTDMTLNLTDIKLFDSSFALRNWDAGEDSISVNGGWMSFEAINDGQKIEFDVTFDLHGTCKWNIETGNRWDNEPDTITQSDVETDITISEVWVNGHPVSVDKTTQDFLNKTIKDNL